MSRFTALTAIILVTLPLLFARSPFDLDTIHFELPFPWEKTIPAATVYHPDSIYRLTEEDFIEVAEELGVEVAAIKAVVEIEAGKTHQGFSAPQKPLANFRLSTFKSLAARRGIKLSSYTSTHPEVFSSARRSGTELVRRIDGALTIDTAVTVESTFWGMFQIGGFNWKLCGTGSPAEFYRLMSRSERDQLELFARFITNSGLLPHLQAKNWAAFARGYNGPAYARRGYHTRMANAYARYKSAEKQ